MLISHFWAILEHQDIPVFTNMMRSWNVYERSNIEQKICIDIFFFIIMISARLILVKNYITLLAARNLAICSVWFNAYWYVTPVLMWKHKLVYVGMVILRRNELVNTWIWNKYKDNVYSHKIINPHVITTLLFVCLFASFFVKGTALDYFNLIPNYVFLKVEIVN